MSARLVLCFVFAFHVLVDCSAVSPGSILAHSSFREGDDGWTVSGDGEIYGVDVAMGRL